MKYETSVWHCSVRWSKCVDIICEASASLSLSGICGLKSLHWISLSNRPWFLLRDWTVTGYTCARTVVCYGSMESRCDVLVLNSMSGQQKPPSVSRPLPPHRRCSVPSVLERSWLPWGGGTHALGCFRGKERGFNVL